MTTRRTLFAAAALAGISSVPAAAQEQTLLERIEQWLLELAPETPVLAYEAITHDDTDSFALEGVDLMPEPDVGAFEIARVEVEALDFDSIVAGQMPTFIAMEMIRIVPPPDSMDDAFTDAFGDEIWLDFAISHVPEEDGGEAAPSNLYLGMNDLVSVQMMGDFNPLQLVGFIVLGTSGIGEPDALGPSELTLDDNGFLLTFFATVARDEGMTTEEFVAGEVLADLRGIGPMFEPGSNAANAIDHLEAFLCDADAPQGPLTIIFAPPSPVRLIEVFEAENPNAVFEMLGLASDYDPGPGTLCPAE